jgi:hypothetical protein
MEATKCLKPPDKAVTKYRDCASVQAATRVIAEQASKRSMCRPTRPPNRGRLKRSGEMSEDYARPLHWGTGGGMYTWHVHKESARNTGSPTA